MHPLRALYALPLLFVSSIATAQYVSLKSTTANDRSQLAITITNQDQALVKERRVMDMESGRFDLAWRDVSTGLRPETTLLRSTDAAGSVRLIEQNFEQSLMTPQSLLEKHVGKSVSVIRTNPATGIETRERAEVLSARDGVVLKFADRIETGVPGRLAFDSVPAGLNDKPALIFSLDNRGPGRQEMELDYLSGGLGWKADYVARVNAAGNKADLSGTFTIVNSTGTTFHDAKLQLLAGDLNLVRQAVPMAMKARSDVMYAPENASQEAFSDYHLYTVSRPVTLAANQTKQIALLSAHGVPVRREWLLTGGEYIYRSAQAGVQKLKVGVFIEFDNDKSHGLGIPLPGGVAHVYGQDASGGMQLAGEDGIGHTPVGEKVRLRLGSAFDVTAQRRQTDFVRIPDNGKQDYAFESGHEIVLKNAKKEAITVTVQETMPGSWQMLSESHPHKKVSSNILVWHIRVPAQRQIALTYRILAR